MTAGGKVFFYVQHLLGIGHLKRAATLARAMSASGLAVTVVSGGESVPVLDTSGMDLVQLPPVRAIDRSFAALVDPSGREIGDAYRAKRRDMLLAAFAACRPDVLIIELFPFGRRQLRFELLPLLDAAVGADPRPKILCSVRDILVEKNRPHRDREMVGRARKYFDKILIHSDPDLISFETTFAPAREIADLINYTGYVVEPGLTGRVAGDEGKDEIIVSSGSGAVGERLLRTALNIRPKSPFPHHVWRLLAGHSLTEAEFRGLQADAPEGVIVERARRDFTTLLSNCRLSISQGGYNTVMEILATGAVGVVVPYAGGHETEQTLRARLLAERGLLWQFPETELTEDKLIETVSAAAQHRRMPPAAIDLNGARRTADIISDLIV